MFFKSASYSAALAALLAEHDLGYIQLVPQNPFARELKEGIIRAFRVGAREGHRFDRQWWIETFNGSSRLVQLNFVAFGFFEVGHVPMLQSAWPRVHNPMVLNKIESKLSQAQRYVERRCGKSIEIRDSLLRLEEWGLADGPKDRNETRTDAPALTFMATMPDSKVCTPITFNSGDVVIAYYENPQTLGESVGAPPPFKYPQLAVVKAKGAVDPHLVVRVEASGMGTPMLCSLDPSGQHRNMGAWSNTDRDSFVRKVAEIVSRPPTPQRPPQGGLR